MDTNQNKERKDAQMDQREAEKIQRDMKMQQMAYMKKLKSDLELMRLEHEHLKLQVEAYQYSQMLEQIRMKEAERAEMIREEKEKQEAAKSARKTASKKIIVPNKEIVDMQGNPISAE
jgi:hypothetical protein